MTTERPRPLIQGQLDGLCGVYSLVQALLHFRGTDNDNVRARYFNGLIENLVSQDRFRSSKIRSGFNRKALKSALAHVIQNDTKLDIEMVDLPEFARDRKIAKVLEAFDGLDFHESIILHLKDPAHWICAYRAKSGKIKCYDSSSDENDRLVNLTDGQLKSRDVSFASGLVILRRTNAQTH